MRKALKLLGLVTVAFGLFLIVASAAFYHLMRVGEFRRFLIDEIEQNTALKVQLGEADLEIGWILGIVFRDLALAEPNEAQPAIAAERITARVELLPLLERKLIFYEVRLHKPIVRLKRDKAGHIPLLDKLLNLPFLKHQDSQFNLDLRAVKLQQARIDLVDENAAGPPVTYRLRDADATIERVRGERLRDFVKDLMKFQRTEPRGAALQFELKSGVEREAAKMGLRAKGKLVFPDPVLEFQNAWWSADFDVVDLPAETVQEYLGRRVAVKSIAGHFAQRVHVEGNPVEGMHLRGELDFRKLVVDAPELFLAPVDAGDGSTSFDVDWSPSRLGVTRVNFRSNELKFSLQGEVRALDSNDPKIQVNLTAMPTSLSALRKFLPLTLLGSSQLGNIVRTFQEGELELKKAGVNAPLSELRRISQFGIGELVWFDAELRNAAGKMNFDGALPLRGVQVRATLAKGVLSFKNGQGAYGESRLTHVEGSYQLAAASGGALDLLARGELDLAELREQVNLGNVSPQAGKIGAYLQDLGGKGKIDLRLARAANGPMQFEGKVTLDNARVRIDDLALSELKGDLDISAKEIKSDKIRALFAGSPIQIQLALKDYASDTATFDLGIESTGVKAGVMTHLLLSSGSVQDPGLVRGSVRYQGTIGNRASRKFTGTLDLVNVQLATKPLLQPFKALNGRIKLDESGIDFQNVKGLLVGFPASFSGRWRYVEKPQLLFDFAAANLDVTYLISQIDPEANDFYANLQAEGRIALSKGTIKSFEFGDLTTAVTIDRRVWRLTNLAARSAGGIIQGVTTIFDNPDTLGIVTEPKVQGVPVQSFLRWFNIVNTEMTGKVNLAGNLETIGKDDAERKRNLNGAFNLKIEDGTIHRLRILVQILNLIDVSRWFTLQLPDLAKQGIRFHSITADFKVNKGVYSTENLQVNSDDLRMTGAGKIDVPKDEIDFVLAVRPFAGIDTVINYIPLLGRGIAAIKNSFLVASFNIKGPIDNPTITPAPLGTLSEWFWGVLGIPKSIIGLSDGEKKEESKEPTQASPK